MAIGADKTQILITIPKTTKEQLKIIADKECRSITAQVNYIINEYLANHTPTPPKKKK